MEKKHQDLQYSEVAGIPKNIDEVYLRSIKKQLQVGEQSDLEDGQVEESHKHNLENQNAGNGNGIVEQTQIRQKDPKVIFLRSRERQANTKLIHKLVVKPNENLEEERNGISKVSAQEMPSIASEGQSIKQEINKLQSLEAHDGQVLSLDQYIQQNKTTTQPASLDIRQRQSQKYSATNRFNVTLSNIESDQSNSNNNGSTPLRQSFKGPIVSNQLNTHNNKEQQCSHSISEQTMESTSFKAQQGSQKSGNELNLLKRCDNPQFHQQQSSQQQQSLFKQFLQIPPPLPIIRSLANHQVGSSQSKPPVDSEQKQYHPHLWSNTCKNSYQLKNPQGNNYFPVHQTENSSQQQQKNQSICQPRSKQDNEQLPLRQTKSSIEYRDSGQLQERLEYPRERKEKLKVYSPIYIPEQHETIEMTQSARKRDIQIEREDMFESGKKSNSLRFNPNKIYGQNLDNSNSKSSSFFTQSPTIIPQSSQTHRYDEYPAGEMKELAPLRQYKSKSTNYKESSLDNHSENSLFSSQKHYNSASKFAQQKPQRTESRRDSYSSSIISDQFKKERLHEQIHQRLQEINKRLQRQKQHKYHTIHLFHRLNCSSVQLGEDTLKHMNFAEFSQYFRVKLERATSPSLEREFGIPNSERTKNYFSNKRTDRSRSRSSKTQRIRDDKRYQHSSKEIKGNLNNFEENISRNIFISEDKLNGGFNDEHLQQDESRSQNLTKNPAAEKEEISKKTNDILIDIMEYHTDDSDSSQKRNDKNKGSKNIASNNTRTLAKESNLLDAGNINKRAGETMNEDEHQIDYDFDS